MTFFKLLACFTMLIGMAACSSSPNDDATTTDALRVDRDDDAEDDSTFECGQATCDRETEYCSKRTTYSDWDPLSRRRCIGAYGPGQRVPENCGRPSETDYRCVAIPPSCDEDRSCGCVARGRECSGSTRSGLRVSSNAE